MITLIDNFKINLLINFKN